MHKNSIYRSFLISIFKPYSDFDLLVIYFLDAGWPGSAAELEVRCKVLCHYVLSDKELKYGV